MRVVQLTRATSLGRAAVVVSPRRPSVALAAPNATFVPQRAAHIISRARRHEPEPEQEPQVEETDFDRETARLAVRMLTARAAGVVLQNVAQVDEFRAAWLREHFAKNPPIEGDTFLTQMLEAKPVVSIDPYTGAQHSINPAQIAAAVLATREALARRLCAGLPAKVAGANVGVMRSHLERHTYVSGTSDESKPSYRQYREARRRQQAQQQHS